MVLTPQSETAVRFHRHSKLFWMRILGVLRRVRRAGLFAGGGGRKSNDAARATARDGIQQADKRWFRAERVTDCVYVYRHKCVAGERPRAFHCGRAKEWTACLLHSNTAPPNLRLRGCDWSLLRHSSHETRQLTRRRRHNASLLRTPRARSSRPTSRSTKRPPQITARS